MIQSQLQVQLLTSPNQKWSVELLEWIVYITNYRKDE